MRRTIFLFILFMGVCLKAEAQGISFTANADKVVVSGQQFRLTYTLTTGGERATGLPRVPSAEGIKLLFGPTVSGENIFSQSVNGRNTSTLSLTYACVLMVEKEGTYTIPEATIKVGNSEYKSNSLEVKALPPDQAAAAKSQNQSSSGQQGQNGVGKDDIFVRAEVSKRSVYENEGFLITYKLYTLLDIAGNEGVKFPEFEGFVSQEIELPQNQQLSLENYNGRNYGTAILKQAILFPQRAGTLTIGAGKFDLIVRVRNQQRVRSIFDEFLDSYQNVRTNLSTPALNIEVKPLPPGKPASFSGTVGDYKMTSSISADQLKANDAVTVNVLISGTGNLNYLKNPDIRFPNDFDIFDAITKNNTKVSASGVSGTRSIEYNAIPRYAGDFTIPSADFSFFDPKSGTYKTLPTGEYKLHVEPGEGGSGNAPIVNANNKEDIRFLGKDIRHIKTSGYDFHKSGFFYGTWKYLIFYIVPLLLFFVIFFIYRKQVAENANIALVRTKKANKVASKRLKTASKYLKENKKEEFYDEILKAVWGYLSDKLNIPVSSLTKDNVEANLSHYGTDEGLIREFMDILNTAEFARFAPVQGSGAMDDLYNSAVQAIDKCENMRMKGTKE